MRKHHRIHIPAKTAKGCYIVERNNECNIKQFCCDQVGVELWL